MSTPRPFTQSSTWQILFGDTIVPRCVSFPCRLSLLIGKLKRSLAKRRQAPAAAPPAAGTGEPEPFIKEPHLGWRASPVINKTVTQIDQDLAQPDVTQVGRDLERLKTHLAAAGLRTTSAAGSFKEKTFVAGKEKNKLWENTWLLAQMPPQAGELVLDVGGASTLFSFYLAWKGCRVAVVDNDWGLHGLIYNARHVARAMKWPMEVLDRDLSRSLPFADNAFDKVFCVCVLEHLSPEVRRRTMSEIGRVLRPRGLCGLTIDFDAGRQDPGYDKGLRFGFPRQLQHDILAPSRLSLLGNQVLTDDCPEPFFLGALFLKKD